MAYHDKIVPSRLMHYLSRYRYADLPSTLFDRYLWLYAEVEKAQHQLVYAPVQPTFRLYENSPSRAETRGIAYVEKDGNQLKVLLDAVDGNGLDDFIGKLKAENPSTDITITVPDEHLGTFLAHLLGWECTPGAIKLYTDQTAPPGPYPAREMFAEDESYLAAISPRPWTAYQIMLQVDYRFFGLTGQQDQLISMCGLVQLTAFRSEIIGVETFAPQDRGKGYAYSVCALALDEGLRSTPVVTWSTKLNNHPSCKTAQYLGFKPIYSLYTLGGSWA